jgi:hypothetical protein
MKKSLALVAGGVVGMLGGLAHAQVWPEAASGGMNGSPDAGQMLATANITEGDGALTSITGRLVTTGDADLYQIRIADPANFVATVAGGGAGNTNLTLFDNTGVALAFNNDDPMGGTGSRLTNTFVPGAGLYYIAVSRNDSFGGFFGIAFDAAFNPIFASSPANVELPPITPGTVLNDWPVSGGFQLFNYNYTVMLTGAEYAVPAPAGAVLFGAGAVVALRRRRR